jgi:hypothetical protein
MKKYIIAILIAVTCTIQGQTPTSEPLPSDPSERKAELKKRIAASPKQPDGYVFQPTGDYPKDVEIDIYLRAPAFICASQLSNLTRKEVFVSRLVQSIPVSEIKMKAYPSILADEIIKKLKESNIAVVELGLNSIALVDIPINYPQPAIILK